MKSLKQPLTMDFMAITRCSNVFAFYSTGKIFYAVINNPGSWHDTQVAFPLVMMVLAFIGIYALCVDSGFKRSGILKDKFVGPLSRKARAKLPRGPERDRFIRKSSVHVSLRQASEWGMRALQGSFSRLKARLSLILSILLLHNFRTQYMGLNQIATGPVNNNLLIITTTIK